MSRRMDDAEMFGSSVGRVVLEVGFRHQELSWHLFPRPGGSMLRCLYGRQALVLKILMFEVMGRLG